MLLKASLQHSNPVIVHQVPAWNECMQVSRGEKDTAGEVPLWLVGPFLQVGAWGIQPVHPILASSQRPSEHEEQHLQTKYT